MSKTVKKVAGFVLPVAGAIIGGPIGGTLGAAVGGSIGGALGGAVQGNGLKGIATGAVLGGAGGAAGGAINGALGTTTGSVVNSTGGIAGGTLGGATSGGFTGASNAVGGLSTAGFGNGVWSGAAGAVGSSAGSAAGNTIGGLSTNQLLNIANVGASVYGGISESNAVKKAAKQQSIAAQNAIANQTNLLQPYIDSGNQTIGGLTKLVNDPTAQKEFIQSNPFYQSLAEDAKDKLFANAAARGKVGSGGTAEALQNSLLLLGSDLLQKDIGNKQVLANNGQTAATNLGNSTSDLLTQQGNAQAAGTIGANNAITGAINNGLAGATELYKINQGVNL